MLSTTDKSIDCNDKDKSTNYINKIILLFVLFVLNRKLRYLKTSLLRKITTKDLGVEVKITTLGPRSRTFKIFEIKNITEISTKFKNWQIGYYTVIF